MRMMTRFSADKTEPVLRITVVWARCELAPLKFAPYITDFAPQLTKNGAKPLDSCVKITKLDLSRFPEILKRPSRIEIQKGTTEIEIQTPVLLYKSERLNRHTGTFTY